MTARCFNDSCGIAWSEVVTGSGPAYQADLVLDPDRSLTCEDGELGVKISSNAGNIVSNIPAGVGAGLFASIPDHVIQNFGDASSLTNVLAGTDSSSPAAGPTHSYTNSTGMDATVIVIAELNMSYAILGDPFIFSYSSGEGARAAYLSGNGAATQAVRNLVPFNAQFAMRLLGDVNAPATTSRASTRISVGGLEYVFNGSDIQYQVVRDTVTFAIDVAAGATLNVKGDAFFQGPDQTINVLATHSSPSIDDDAAGFSLFRGQFIAIPHG